MQLQDIDMQENKDINSDAFCQSLDKVNWNMNELDVHQYGTNFLHVFNQILDTHTTLIKTKN